MDTPNNTGKFHKFIGRTCVKTFKFYRDDYPGIEIASIYLNEYFFSKRCKDPFGKDIKIDILVKELVPDDIICIKEVDELYKYLFKRTEHLHNQFYRMYRINCGENPSSVFEKVKLSEGRQFKDTLYIIATMEIILDNN